MRSQALTVRLWPSFYRHCIAQQLQEKRLHRDLVGVLYVSLLRGFVAKHYERSRFFIFFETCKKYDKAHMHASCMACLPPARQWR